MPDRPSLESLEARLDRIEAVLVNRIPPVIDPPPDDFGRWPGSFHWPRPFPYPFPWPGDPPPIDISRFTKTQLQLALESIKAQRIRLDAIEKMIGDQMKQVG